MSEQLRPGLRRALVAVLILGCMMAVDIVRERATMRIRKVKETNDVYALPSPEIVHRLAIGYDDAVVAVLWASTLYQYGEHVGENRRFQYPTEYAATILHLEPRFKTIYRFLSALTTMQAVVPERYELNRVRDLLKSGTVEFPADPEVWGAYASFMMYEGAQYLGDAEKQAWRIEGAFAAQRAVELGFFMNNLNLSGANFLERAGHRELAIAQLERAYAVAPNDAAREQIAGKLRRLQGAAALDRVAKMQTFFVDRWKNEAPFSGESLFLLVGPRRDVASCAGLAGNEPACAIGWTGALQLAMTK